MKPNIARILLKPKGIDHQKQNIPPSLLQFDPVVMVDMFPGPALLIDGEMNVKHHNDVAKSLLIPLEAREPFLTSMISRCLSNGCPDSQKTTLNDPAGLRHYDLFAFPVKTTRKSDTPLIFLFGRETTIENNLTNALVDSRQMFKDLVSCSTDFAWETDKEGRFIYASPKGILGYTAYELNGRNSGEMIIGDSESNPFKTMDKVTEMELWLQSSDGTMACLLVSAVPIWDNQSTWQGARGVCRDITVRREQEAVLRRTRKREHILGKIVSTIRDMVTPSDMLENALTATMEGIPSDSCYILQKTDHGKDSFKAEVKQHRGSVAETELIYSLCQKAMSYWSQTGSTPDRKEHLPTEVLCIDGHHILMGITSHHGTNNGAIFLIRDRNKPFPRNNFPLLTSQQSEHQVKHWHDDEIHLFKGITAHLGIALEQVTTYEELEKRASTDEMTNLLNRRAFTQIIKQRIKNQQRSRLSGAMLYLDLDNFKNVNDTKGHAHGDMILKQLAYSIRENIRVGDYAARLGGDEFAIWLDETSKEDAQTKAQHFIAAGNSLAHLADVEGPQLSLSIGLAFSNPDEDPNYDDLMNKADKALYQAKLSGKASYVLYDPKIINQNPEETKHA